MLKKTPISVLILTKNEEQDLPECIASLSWSDDIHVLDSYSTDRTVEIAQQFGAKVVQRAFDNWASHQNWALKNINFKNNWIYYSDADERVTVELAKKMSEICESESIHSAYRVKRRDYLNGSWLKYVTPSPFNIRLFRNGKVSYERLTNPITLVDGSIGDIDAHFNHYPFSKGMDHWFSKHNSYSMQEAQQIVKNNIHGSPISIWSAVFSDNKNERRFHQKEIYYKMPLRPLLMFVILYFIKGGFLDGRAGLRFSILRSIYEYMIMVKVEEVKSANKLLTIK